PNCELGDKPQLLHRGTRANRRFGDSQQHSDRRRGRHSELVHRQGLPHRARGCDRWGCAWRQISSHRLQPGRQVPVMEPESTKPVLVRGPNWVGDAVMSIPALKRLREMFPHAHLTMLAPDSISDLLAGEGLADEFVRADDGVMGFLRQVRLLRRRHFDLAVLLQNAFRAALLARASGARSVAGYPTDGRGLLLSTSVPFPANYKKDHQVLY